jgi:hypothetical protein
LRAERCAGRARASGKRGQGQTRERALGQLSAGRAGKEGARERAWGEKGAGPRGLLGQEGKRVGRAVSLGWVRVRGWVGLFWVFLSISQISISKPN